MNAQDTLQYLGSISVMKATTGSVSVTTPSGPVLLQVPGHRYEIARNPDEVAALLKMSNIADLLRKRVITLVF